MCSNYPGIKLKPALKTKLNICHHMLTSSTQLQNKSFHVVERTRTSSKCQKMKNARAKRAKVLFFIVKYANLWGFCCRCRRGCLSSLINPLSCPLNALPLQPHPYPKKDSNKPISYTSSPLVGFIALSLYHHQTKPSK